MRRTLWMASGVLLWALHFATIYGFTGLACARGLDRAVPGVVGAATVVAAAWAVWIVSRGARRREGFVDAIAAGLAALALLGIVWEGSAIFLVPPCVSR